MKIKKQLEEKERILNEDRLKIENEMKSNIQIKQKELDEMKSKIEIENQKKWRKLKRKK